MSNPPTVLIAVSHGFQERLLLRSGVADHLLNHGTRIVVACPGAELIRIDGWSSGDVRAVQFAPEPGRLQRRYYTGRKLLLWRREIDGALLNFEAIFKRKYPLLHRTVKAARSMPWSWRLGLDQVWMRDFNARQLLEHVRPDLVVMASPGFHYADAVLLGEAVRSGIKTAVVGQSWDNFSSKGYVHPKPDLMICWGERMREEAIGLQDWDPGRIVVCGAPHFDVYHNLARFGTREQVLERLGLDPRRRLIVYGTSPRVHAGDERDVVRRLADWVQQSPVDGPFRYPLQLLIRLHPQQVSGPYSDDWRAYQALVGEHVSLDVPEMVPGEMDWQIASSDSERLPLILAQADVVVNCFSTFAIDAVAAGKPAICVAFDGDEVREGKYSVRRYLNYTHLKAMISSGGVRVADDYIGLQREIEAYLAEPSRDAAGRQVLIRMQLYQIDGRSAERTAAALAGMIIRTERKGRCELDPVGVS
jgi:hypothetical protein